MYKGSSHPISTRTSSCTTLSHSHTDIVVRIVALPNYSQVMTPHPFIFSIIYTFCPPRSVYNIRRLKLKLRCKTATIMQNAYCFSARYVCVWFSLRSSLFSLSINLHHYFKRCLRRLYVHAVVVMRINVLRMVDLLLLCEKPI